MNYHQIKQLWQNNLWFGENRHKTKSDEPAMSVIAPPVNAVWGIDISHWNVPPVDLKRMKEQFGMSFVVIKGADGSLRSRYFFEHVQAAKAAGLPFGMYVWLYRAANVNMDAQVNTWVSLAREFEPPLGVFIDAEKTTYGGVVSNPQTSDLTAAHDKFAAAYGRQAATYTAKYYADENLATFDWGKYPLLWIANYGVSTPALPSAFVGKWKFWQYTNQLDGSKLDPNGNLSIDGNYYIGTAAEFAAEYGGTVPPPTGDNTMDKYKVTGASGLNLRPAPATNNTPLKLVASGSYIWGVPDIAGWIRGSHYQQPGEQYATPLDFYCVTSLVAKEAVYTPPPAPAATVTSIVIDLAPGSVVTVKKSDGSSVVFQK